MSSSSEEVSSKTHLSWYDDIESLLNDIRTNSIILEKVHRKNYFHYKSFLKYFRIPSIVFNGINSVLSVSMSNYVSQDITSATTCCISLFIAIISSIEIYLSIQTNMENSYTASKEHYNLAIEIYKVLQMERIHRNINGKGFLESCFNKYQKLVENSNLSNTKNIDKLVPLQNSFSLSSSSSENPNEEGVILLKTPTSVGGHMFEMGEED